MLKLIETQKGWLEPLQPSHDEALFQIIHNSRSHLYRWLPWLQRIHSVQDTRAFIADLIDERGPQFVVCVNYGICGAVGFYEVDKRERSATLGYWLGADYAGQGIMHDALQALCRFGFGSLGLERIEIHCALENSRSRRVPERLGFFFEGVKARAEWLIDRYVDHAIYSIESRELAADVDLSEISHL